MSVQVFSYFGDSTNMLERQIQNLIDRGGEVSSVAIGYGPTPAMAAGRRGAEPAWHALVVVEVDRIDPNA